MNSTIIKSDDSFLSKEEIEEYLSLVSSHNFPWYLHKKTSIGYDIKTDKEKEDSVLIHVAYLDGVPNSEHYQIFKNLFDRFCTKNNIDYAAILRIRLNLFFSRENQLPTGAHVDTNKAHKVFLYYFNDSDGDTIFYDNLYDGVSAELSQQLVEIMRSEPKAGKAIVFEGNRYHSPTTPKKSRYRITLNIDFV